MNNQSARTKRQIVTMLGEKPIDQIGPREAVEHFFEMTLHDVAYLPVESFLAVRDLFPGRRLHVQHTPRGPVAIAMPRVVTTQ